MINTELLEGIPNVEELKRYLKASIKGQDHVIDLLAPTIRRNWLRPKRQKPIASFLFVGPSGTGKSELARLLADKFCGSRDNIVQISCQQLKMESQVSSLTGNAKVYQSSAPGTLTGPVKNNPKCVILFDEIDKAHPSTFDLFLGMLDEGKLKDDFLNKWVLFNESIIIFTSNSEQETLVELQEKHKGAPNELTDAAKEHLSAAHPEKFRPELLSRFDLICIFKPLDLRSIIQITANSIEQEVREHEMELDRLEEHLVAQIAVKFRKSTGAPRLIAGEIRSLLGEQLAAAQENGLRRVAIARDDDGKIAIHEAGRAAPGK